MATHLRVVAALFLVGGGLCLASGLVLGIFFGGLARLAGRSEPPGTDIGPWVLSLAGAAFTTVMIVAGVPAIATGWGLFRVKRWARTLGIILAAIALINFWIGTVFGVYALWVLLNKRTEDIFGDEKLKS
jgi:hypothetical protein